MKELFNSKEIDRICIAIQNNFRKETGFLLKLKFQEIYDTFILFSAHGRGDNNGLLMVNG